MSTGLAIRYVGLMPKARSEYPSEMADKFVVRLPDGMRDRIAEAAERNGRSMNAEIVKRLEWSFLAEASPKEAVTEIRTDVITKLAVKEFADFDRLLKRFEAVAAKMEGK